MAADWEVEGAGDVAGRTIGGSRVDIVNSVGCKVRTYRMYEKSKYVEALTGRASPIDADGLA
jgi:hypothetical protein